MNPWYKYPDLQIIGAQRGTAAGARALAEVPVAVPQSGYRPLVLPLYDRGRDWCRCSAQIAAVDAVEARMRLRWLSLTAACFSQAISLSYRRWRKRGDGRFHAGRYLKNLR